jgi:hypothetical protein
MTYADLEDPIKTCVDYLLQGEPDENVSTFIPIRLGGENELRVGIVVLWELRHIPARIIAIPVEMFPRKIDVPCMPIALLPRKEKIEIFEAFGRHNIAFFHFEIGGITAVLDYREISTIEH